MWRTTVQRSSETIGTIAAALAKAQAQLVNPEKSLVATIRSDEASGPDRSFCYAPLSSGLDIVRKTLSQHEIATVQTTAIDETAGIVRLSTVLAHASGEWIASDWPVCAISETGTPHRMGAALTYARRYALFTLVGIAGEDDLDAPAVTAPTTQASKAERPAEIKKGHLTGAPEASAQKVLSGRQAVSSSSKPILDPEASGALRDQLLAEITDINSAEEAAHWARRSISAKNTLTPTDAECVEQAFQTSLATFAANPADEPQMRRDPRHRLTQRGKKQRQNPGIDKTRLALPTPHRIRDREHVKSVAQQPCLVCGRRPADAHHLRFAQLTALGRKVSDEFTVPLCRGHHREVHYCGDEPAWWQRTGIDPTVSARVLWLKTHPLPPVHLDLKVANSASSTNLQSKSKRQLTIARQGQNYKTKPISENSSL
jgi:hypothetical protein